MVVYMDIQIFISHLRVEAKKYHKQYTPTPEQNTKIFRCTFDDKNNVRL